MLLDEKIQRGDHSFKFPKHMANIEGTTIFTGLYTMTNEYEEITHQVLVPSKSLTYLKYSFEKMRNAYIEYGYEMRVAFFTDNVTGDKNFVETIFPSLKNNVQPRTSAELSELQAVGYQTLELPDDVVLKYVNRNSDEIENEMRILLSEMRTKIESGEDVAVGFDCEWVPFSGGVQVDVVQIAYHKKVLVFHLDLVWHVLPPSLLEFLRNDQIKKCGRMISNDLGRFNKRYHLICKSGLELGSFCSARKCIPSGNASLSEISFRVLGCKISKDERLSDWGCIELSDEQRKYAAIDAWVSLLIYDIVKEKQEVGTRVSDRNCLLGTYVALKAKNLN